MRDKLNNPRCLYIDNIECQGDSFLNVIRYKESDVDKLLNENNYIELLRLVFHECTHTFQHFYIHTGSLINGLLFLQTKEQVIRDNYPNYYKENYNSYLEEVEARYSEYRSLLEIMSVFGLKMSDKANGVINTEMEKENEKFEDRKRVFNGKDTTLDEMFNSIELTDDDLHKYPLLNIQYKIENGQVVEKSVDELDNDYNIYMDKTVNENEKEQIEYLYKSILKVGYHK